MSCELYSDGPQRAELQGCVHAARTAAEPRCTSGCLEREAPVTIRSSKVAVPRSVMAFPPDRLLMPEAPVADTSHIQPDAVLTSCP